MAEQYGPVYTLRRGSNVMIIVAGVQAAIDILERQGGVTLSRPEAVAAGTILSKGQRLLLQPAGELFRRMRKAIHDPLQPKAAKSYAPIQYEAAKRYILNILEHPGGHQRHADLYAATVVLKVSYGKSAPSSFDHPDIQLLHKVVARFQTVVRPGSYLVDFVPWLRYVPRYARELKEFRNFELGFFHDQIGKTKATIEQGVDGPSFTRYLLENVDVHGLNADEMAYLAGGLYAAGSDSTSIGMSSIILAAVSHPELQAKIHAEMDALIGDRAPIPDDMGNMPYLDAFIQETLRWRPILPLGFMHKTTADVVWEGYHIPEGATILGCHWAIARDPVAFPDPERFDPQRWLDAEGQLKPQKDIRYFTYGFGRRVCPGQYVANRSMFVTMSLLFWSFRLVEDPAHPVDVDAFDGGVASHHTGFKVGFEPRRSVEEIRAVMSGFDL
ncbi:cytochrome P450 [Coniophora puteana RWD-64-598 SS2]|uniref:Cytochrome P450 n=1 Tax=Coniophora puteana (strain RWD-64-598) TaxID=741705 RepID=A0A5M3N4C5_CONPW|nr:cytochrome P450 [Coniophora puteana RWD-64-598 SS2]EIW85894.1 cytochrome P450 [Coniophora puteana RWD-64-598 SS2]